MTYFIIVKSKKRTGECDGTRREDKRHFEPPPDFLFHESQAFSKGTGNHQEMGRNGTLSEDPKENGELSVIRPS